MTKLSGGLNNYYVVPIKNPQRKEQEPYQAECEDIIQALGMTFDEGCAFKALWRNAAARMGNGKPGNKALYDCEKLVHYANRILNKEKVEQAEPGIPSPVGSGWIYSNKRPNVTQPYSSITVLYEDESIRSYAHVGLVDWEIVKQYRIDYS